MNLSDISAGKWVMEDFEKVGWLIVYIVFFFRESLIWKYLGFHYQYPLAIASWNFDYDFRVNINTLINNSVLHIQRTPHLQGEDGNVRVQGGNMLKCCLSIGEPEIACYIWILNKVT